MRWPWQKPEAPKPAPIRTFKPAEARVFNRDGELWLELDGLNFRHGTDVVRISIRESHIDKIEQAIARYRIGK